MLADLGTQYPEDLLLLLSKVAFLDPQLKALPFLSSSELKEVTKSIEYDAMHYTGSTKVPSESQAPAKKKKGEHQLFKITDDIMNSDTIDDQQPVITNHQKARAEVSRYSSEPSTADDPLAWQRANSFRYPLLSHLAKNI